MATKTQYPPVFSPESGPLGACPFGGTTNLLSGREEESASALSFFQSKNKPGIGIQACTSRIHTHTHVRAMSLIIISFYSCFLLDDFFRLCKTLVFNQLRPNYDIFAKRFPTFLRKSRGNPDIFAGQSRHFCENPAITTFLRFFARFFPKNTVSVAHNSDFAVFQMPLLRHFCDSENPYYDIFAIFCNANWVNEPHYPSLNQ